ncbi:hypothetical protein X746_28655 [Mesorhizobium sp. LNJC380A00]|nr:hypothetical protein X746_28655 [Mesorhizobium sp. LNJC380A00]
MEYAEELAAILNANDLKQRLSHGPDMEYAEELAAILNANDLKQRLSHGRFPGGFA